MLWAIRWAAWAVLRSLLTLRYKVKLVGVEAVLKRPGPYLIMPNHPAYTDPPNLLVRLWPIFKMRPLLLETNFQKPDVRAVRVADARHQDAGHRPRQRRRQAARRSRRRRRDRRAAGRRERDPVAERPAQPRRHRAARRGAHRRRRARRRAERHGGPRPHPRAVGQHVQLGRRPAVPRARLPPRAGAVGREPVPLRPAPARHRRRSKRSARRRARSRPAKPSTSGSNEWYNADVPREEPTFVPRHFLFGPRTHEFPPPVAAVQEYDLSKVKPETKATIAQMVEEKLKRPLGADADNADATLNHLGVDSLDAMDLSLAVEQRFGFGSDTVPTTLGGLWAIAEGLQQNAPPKPPPAGWFDPTHGQRAARNPRRDGERRVPEPSGQAAEAGDRGRRPRGRRHLREVHRRHVGDVRAVPRDRRAERRADAPRGGRVRPRVPRRCTSPTSCR